MLFKRNSRPAQVSAAAAETSVRLAGTPSGDVRDRVWEKHLIDTGRMTEKQAAVARMAAQGHAIVIPNVEAPEFPPTDIQP